MMVALLVAVLVALLVALMGFEKVDSMVVKLERTAEMTVALLVAWKVA